MKGNKVGKKTWQKNKKEPSSPKDSPKGSQKGEGKKYPLLKLGEMDDAQVEALSCISQPIDLEPSPCSDVDTPMEIEPSPKDDEMTGKSTPSRFRKKPVKIKGSAANVGQPTGGIQSWDTMYGGPAKLTQVWPPPATLAAASSAAAEPSAGSSASITDALKAISAHHKRVHWNDDAPDPALSSLILDVLETKNVCLRAMHQRSGAATSTAKRCKYGRDKPNKEFYQFPTYSIVNATDPKCPSTIEGGQLRTLPRFTCESCGYTSNKYSNFIFVDKDDFTPLS